VLYNGSSRCNSLGEEVHFNEMDFGGDDGTNLGRDGVSRGVGFFESQQENGCETVDFWGYEISTYRTAKQHDGRQE